jgi:hypothetical protein
MCLDEAGELREKIAQAETKGDGGRCIKYFDANLNTDACRENFKPRDNATTRSLGQQLAAAVDDALGKRVSGDRPFTYYAEARLYLCGTTVNKQSVVLLYFTDLVKGLVYVQTGVSTFEIYYLPMEFS